MCSEIASPRISFSYNLRGDQGCAPIEYRRRDITLLDSKVEFEFNISSIEHEYSSSADELFRNGIILPIKVQSHKQMRVVNNVSTDINSSHLEQREAESKCCRGSKRSSNSSRFKFESKRTYLCPIPPVVSRSNSIGSTDPITTNSKKYYKQKHDHQQYYSTSMRKLSLKNNQYHPNPLRPHMCNTNNPGGGGVYGNYHYIGPVLNLSPKFFAFGSLLLCGLDKKTKK